MDQMSCKKAAEKDNPLDLPKGSHLRTPHPNPGQTADPYYARLKQQREKLIGYKPDVTAPVQQKKTAQKTLIMTDREFHQSKAPLQSLGKPPEGWMPKDKLMSIVRQISEAKKMKTAVT